MKLIKKVNILQISYFGKVTYRMAFLIYGNKKNRNSEMSQGEGKGNTFLDNLDVYQLGSFHFH